MNHRPKTKSDKVAYALTKSLRYIADRFFMKRYCHRSVMLETVAGVPGMVSGMWLHLMSLRKMKTGYGPKIRTLLAEAENERMHLMTFIAIAQPNWFERAIVILTQFIFWHIYFLLYIFFPKTAHRMVGYFEEEAVISYTHFLEEIDNGSIENVPAPQIAIKYWNLPADARLREVVVAVRGDEMSHRDTNHKYAEE